MGAHRMELMEGARYSGNVTSIINTYAYRSQMYTCVWCIPHNPKMSKKGSRSTMVKEE